MDRMEWTNPTTVAQAIADLQKPGATLKAGGVDLMDLLKEGIARPSRLVNLSRLPGLDRIAENAASGYLELGPLATLARIAADPLVLRRYRVLADAAGHAATPQVRNMATVGGNLLQRPRCWYFRAEEYPCRRKGGSICYALEGENAYHAISGNTQCAIVHPSAMATALLCLGASLEVVGAGGARLVSLEGFFVPPEKDITREHLLAPGEVIVGIRVPLPDAPSGAGLRSAYTKQGEKESFDWPLAEVAVALRIGALGRVEQASIVLGAFAPVPHRAVAAEKALVGKTISDSTARAAARAALAGARPLSQNGYKVPLFETVIARTIRKAVV